MKIGVLVKPDISNAIYRAITPMLALEQLGHEVVLAKRTLDDKFSLDGLVNCDVVHVYRGTEDPKVIKGVDEPIVEAPPSSGTTTTMSDWSPRTPRATRAASAASIPNSASVSRSP